MQFKQLLAIVPLILAAIVGGCVGVVTSPSPLAPAVSTPKIGELPVTQTPARDLAQAPITLNGGESVNVLCPDGRIASARVSKTQVVVLCVGVSATVTPTVTAVPPTPTLTPTPAPPTRTLTPVPPTITATRTSTPVPPTRTPAPPTRTPTVPAPTTPVAGHTYYVGTTGDDVWPGTLSQPWKTIRHAVDMMAGGDTVYILAGTYNEPIRFFYKSNPTSQYMTLTNFPGATVVIDGTNVPFSYSQEGLVYISSTDYVRIAGLRIQNANMAGIYVGYSDHIEIVKNQTYNTRTSGIGIWGATNVLVDGNNIELACNGGGEEQLKIDGSSYVEVRNNEIHHSTYNAYGGEGLNISGGAPSASGAHDIKVHHNVVHDIAKLGFGVEAWQNRLYNVEVYDNISYNNAWGFIVASEQGGSDEDVKIYNNIAYNNANAGFAIPWWSGTMDGLHRNVQFVNNTAYNNGTGFTVQSPRNEGVIFRNNILFQNRNAVSIIAGAQGQITLDHNLTSDPLFANPAAADFHLQSGSPAIDAGDATNAPGNDFDGKARPRGAGFDIGAFEN